MNSREFVEIEVSGETFRTRRERTLLAESVLQKTLAKDGAIGYHDLIKADCEIYDRNKQSWRQITDKDIENIPRSEGEKLLNKINEIRGEERDFQKSQMEKS